MADSASRFVDCHRNGPKKQFISGVKFVFACAHAGITFKVPAGSFVAVCGKNGVGKSTLFKLLLRLYDVDEGQIRVGGRDIKE